MMRGSSTVNRAMCGMVVLLVLAACSGSPDLEGRTGVVAELPEGTRESTGGPDPRTATAWAGVSVCSDSDDGEPATVVLQEALAGAGLAIGDHRLATCEEALSILGGEGDENLFDDLAARLLAADLNALHEAATCEAADQAARAAQLAFAGLEYAGRGTITVEPGRAALQLIDLLTFYNSGDLCV